MTQAPANTLPSDTLPAAPTFGEAVPMTQTPELLKFLAVRRSSSAMNLQGPGPSADQIDALIRLAARVPDHGKLTPWRFVVLDGQNKAAFAERLDAIAAGRGEPNLQAKLGKLKVPPTAIVVISSPRPGKIPEWEQILSSGVVCTNLLYSAIAMGFGATWITDWYSYDAEALAALGLTEGERVAGFLMIGTARDAPLERERPNTAALVTRWQG